MKRAHIALLITLLALARPASADDNIPYAVSNHPSQDGRCEGDTGKADLDRDERACLDQLKDIAVRNGRDLRITFRDGTTRTYVTRPPDDLPGHEDDSIEYKLVGYFPEHALLLIQISYWEGGEWILLRLDRGTETKIHAPPHYSPDRRWLFSVCSSEGPSGCGNGMDIVAASPDLKLRGWHYLVPDDDYTLYEFVGWENETRVKLTATFRVGEDMKTFPASVERVGGAWRLKLPREHQRPAQP